MLHVNVSGFVPVDGETSERTFGTYDVYITVTETLPAKVGRFLGNNWQWIIATLLIPAGTAAWLYCRKRHSPRAA